MQPNTAFFIGAHPDDIEIACGGTVAKLAKSGWLVHTLIVTDDANQEIAIQRRAEAVAAAAALGLPQTNVNFLGIRDGHVHASISPEIIGRLREITKRIAPTVVITHTNDDDHQDHSAVNRIVCSAIRDVPRLYFAVVNHIRNMAFIPSVFIDISDFIEQKFAGLRCHVTQDKLGRIKYDAISRLDNSYLTQSGLSCCEAYAVEFPGETYSATNRKWLGTLNDSALHQLWSRVAPSDRLTIISSVPNNREHTSPLSWRGSFEQIGLGNLRDALLNRYASGAEEMTISVISSDRDSDVEAALVDGSCILITGGPVSNTVTRDQLNHFRGIRYYMDYDMPGYRDIRIIDRLTSEAYRAEYGRNPDSGAITVLRETAIISIVKNPYNIDSTIVSIAGIHGGSTGMSYKYLYSPSKIMELLPHLSANTDFTGLQALADYDQISGDIAIKNGSIHYIGG